MVPVRLVPLKLTELPTTPLVGLMLIRLGPGTKVNVTPLLVPPGVVTVTEPVRVPLGTTTPVICVPAALTVYPEVTVLFEVPVKVMTLGFVRPVPVRVTTVFAGPLAGLTLVRVGMGVVILISTPSVLVL